MRTTNLLLIVLNLTFAALASENPRLVQMREQSAKTCAENLVIDYGFMAGKIDEKPDSKDLFRAGEFQIEVAGQGRTKDLRNYDKSLAVGANYYVTEGAGIHAAVGFRDANDRFVDRVEAGVIGRFTFPKFNLAIPVGAGAEWERATETLVGNETTHFNRVNVFSVYAESGILFRVSPNLDIFAKVRGVRPIDGPENEHIAFIVGLDIPL